MAVRRVKRAARKRWVFDSSAFIASLRLRSREPADRAARALVDHLTGRGESINITVLSAAEILVKGDVHPAQLRGSGITQLPFDRSAAERVAADIPMSRVKGARDADTRRRPLQYWKTDRLIVGCILRWDGCLITADEDQARFARDIGLEAWHVVDLARQLSL